MAQIFTTDRKIENEGGIISEFITAARQIRYNAEAIAPHYNEMAAWERKEYESCHADNVAIFNSAKAKMMNFESTFNELLFKYNMSVAVFICKYGI